MNQPQINWIANFFWGVADASVAGKPAPQLLRTLEEIRAYILALEKETEVLLGEIIGRAS